MSASAAFAPITGPPTDDDLIKLKEALINTLFSVCLFVTMAGCPSGIVFNDATYIRSTSLTTTLDHMTAPFSAFNPSISSTTKLSLLSKKEELWKAKLANQI